MKLSRCNRKIFITIQWLLMNENPQLSASYCRSNFTSSTKQLLTSLKTFSSARLIAAAFFCINLFYLHSVNLEEKFLNEFFANILNFHLHSARRVSNLHNYCACCWIFRFETVFDFSGLFSLVSGMILYHILRKIALLVIHNRSC